MTQDKRSNDVKRSDVHKKNEQNVRNSSKETTNSSSSAADIPTKVVIRRLPPLLTADAFLQHISPVPEYDYFRFAEAELGLGPNAFTRAYLNFVNPKDIWIFQEKFDGYVFLDDKGNEYPAVVEFAPYPRISKKRNKKPDPRKATIEQDPDYLKFLDKLKSTETETIPPPESLLEEIEAREKLLKANHGCPKTMTPLIEYLTKRKEEKRNAIVHAREEKRRKEVEKQKQLEERRKKLEKERKDLIRQKQKEKEERKKEDSSTATSFKLLRNPEREKDKKDSAPAAVVVETDTKETASNRVEADVERTKSSRSDESRSKEFEKKSFEITDRRQDDRRDGKDKGRKTERTFVERRKEDDKRRDGENLSTKDLSYGARKKTDAYGDHGYRQNDRDKAKDRSKDSDNTEKEQVWEKGQERESGARSTGYHGYGKHRESDGHRDGKRETKSDYKFDGQRQKESTKPSAKDSQYQKESSYEYRGGRRFHQETRGPSGRTRGGSYDSRRDSGSYDSRRDSGNYDNWKESDGKSYSGYQYSRGSGTEKASSKAKISGERGSSEGVELGDKERSPSLVDDKRKDPCDNAEIPKSDFSKSSASKMMNDDEESSSSIAVSHRNDDNECGGKGNFDKDGSGSSNKQRVRYKDRPERAIYNPAKRATERQKETGSSR